MSEQIESQAAAPFTDVSVYHGTSGLWLYGNLRLLRSNLAYMPSAIGPGDWTADELQAIERETELLVLDSKTLVCGVHGAAHQRTAVVPLRWGAPRIVVLSGGFHYHLGPKLDHEPFRAARLWRYRWDALVDLAISRRAPDKLPTFASHNPTIDRLIVKLASGELLAQGL
ncbi:MAG: hypothetical protein H0W86_00070 [Armatimonadetes bacterium]|nr:hypothetical protein [Armatimonadota bacterium]